MLILSEKKSFDTSRRNFVGHVSGCLRRLR